MSEGGFALLLSFALVKMALGLALILFGLRGGSRREPDQLVSVLPPAPEAPLGPGHRTRGPRAHRRGGPRTAPVGRRTRV